MKLIVKTTFVLGLLLGLGACEQSAKAPKQHAAIPPAAITLAQAEEIFDYAYPLVIMKISQDMMFTAPFRPQSHPNHIIMFKRLAMPQNRAVVLGNRNTLYSVGWVDLSKGPVLFEIPDMSERY
jgi:hypothetical protein